MVDFYLLLFAIIGIPIILLGLLLYFIPKKLGKPKLGKYLVSNFGILILALSTYIIFEDYFFFKSDAEKFLSEQNFQLKNDFKIKKNESFSAIGDYYHTFTLDISENDRNRIIQEIKNSENFKKENDTTIQHFLFQTKENEYTGSKIIQNYETQSAFIREYFQHSEKQGYAPTFRRISISKTENELIFEDIDE